MNFLAICTILAAIATFAYGKPAQQNSNTTDWAAVAILVAEIEISVVQGAQNVIDAAVSDNEQVGNTIAEQVKTTANTVNVTFIQIHVAVEAQTLTDVQATELLGQVRGSMARLLGGIKELLLQLSALTEIRVRHEFTVTFDKIEAHGEALNGLLLA